MSFFKLVKEDNKENEIRGNDFECLVFMYF